MDLRRAFAKAFRAARRASGLTQEDFAIVSSRTYVSSLERGMKSPTLDKMHELCEALRIHPVTLLALTYLEAERNADLNALLSRVRSECREVSERASLA